MTFEQNGSEISYRSYRKWYEDTEATPHRYVYQWVINHIYAFEVARMTYVIGTYDGENYDLSNRPANFSEISVSVDSAFAYTYMDAPGATGSDFNNYHVFDSYKTRTFTPNNPADSDVSYEHHAAYGNDVCVGFKIIYPTLSLTYSCSY